MAHRNQTTFSKSHVPVHELTPNLKKTVNSTTAIISLWKGRQIQGSASKNLFLLQCLFHHILTGSPPLPPTEPQDHIWRDYALIHSIGPARSRPSFHCGLLKRQRSKVLSRNRNTAVLLSEISKTDLKLTTSKLDSI